MLLNRTLPKDGKALMPKSNLWLSEHHLEFAICFLATQVASRLGHPHVALGIAERYLQGKPRQTHNGFNDCEEVSLTVSASLFWSSWVQGYSGKVNHYWLFHIPPGLEEPDEVHIPSICLKSGVFSQWTFSAKLVAAGFSNGQWFSKNIVFCYKPVGGRSLKIRVGIWVSVQILWNRIFFIWTCDHSHNNFILVFFLETLQYKNCVILCRNQALVLDHSSGKNVLEAT